MTDETSTVSLETLRNQWFALTQQERVDGFRLLAPADAHDLFDSLSGDEEGGLISALPPREATMWMRFLPPDDAADVLQAAVLVAPAVEGLLADLDPLAHLADARTRRQQRISLTQLGDDLFGTVPCPLHEQPPGLLSRQ